MTKTIVITRPKGDETSLTELLHERGYRVIHEPLTDIFLLHTERLALHHALLDEPDAVIATSRHAVQALALLSDLRDAFLLCVGEATAEVAYSLGFTRVDTASGTVDSLIDKIAGAYDEDARFLYICGRHTRVDLAGILQSMGMQAESLVLYDAIAAEQLSDTLLAHFGRRHVDAVTFMSPRNATIFKELLEKAGAADAVRHMEAIALSENVAACLQSQPWKAVHIAPQPTLASLVECVDNILGDET